MGTLQDALRDVGIASEKQLREAEAVTQLRAEMEIARLAQPTKEKEKRLGILRETSSPDSFRHESRKLLLLYPDLVQELLNIAHARGMQKKKDKGGTRLIANLYQVKEALHQGSLSDEDKKALVDKLFSKK
ncbi:MAG: hypothetical protein Q7S34_04220 [bacterium]|nr:hypothetical protein [bacterium]